METIKIQILQDDVYEEVAKATDYTGSKLPDADADTRDRILMGDAEQTDLRRFWEEAILGVNENFKQMLLSGSTVNIEQGLAYEAVLEVSKSFDKLLTSSIQSVLRSYFISVIIGQWFKFANKGEAPDYFTQATEALEAAERMLYSRKKPKLPTS